MHINKEIANEQFNFLNRLIGVCIQCQLFPPTQEYIKVKCFAASSGQECAHRNIFSHVVMDAFGVTAVNAGYVSFCGSIIYPVVSHLSKKDTQETAMLTPLLTVPSSCPGVQVLQCGVNSLLLACCCTVATMISLESLNHIFCQNHIFSPDKMQIMSQPCVAQFVECSLSCQVCI